MALLLRPLIAVLSLLSIVDDDAILLCEGDEGCPCPLNTR